MKTDIEYAARSADVVDVEVRAMQAELERLPVWLDEWIDENCELGHDNKQWVVDEGCLRALLSRFTLCKKEPRYYCTYDRCGYYVVSPTLSEAERDFPGRQHVPLYAPASLNADIGKEGGE